MERVALTHDTFFGGFTGTPAQMQAYLVLDDARIALLEGAFDSAQAALDEFDDLAGR